MRNGSVALCVVVALLSALVVACGPEPAPTDTPAPTPILEPLEPSRLAPPEDLDSFVFTEEVSWEGTAPDGTEVSYQSSTIITYVGDPMAFQITGTSNEPYMQMALEAAGAEGNTMDAYFVEGSLYIPVLGSWMQVSLDAPTSATGLGELPFDPEHLTLGDAYTVTQWLDVAEAVGSETYEGIDVEHYRFDETAFNPDLLPTGMEVEEASGNLYVTVEGGYMLHMDMTLSGTGLVLSAEAEEPTLSEGTLVYRADLSSINEPVAIELPEEAVQATLLPEDIPVPADASQWMAYDLMGAKSFLFASDSSPEDVAAFFRVEMPENGWTESSAAEEAGAYAFMYIRDDRSVKLDFGPDDDSDKTLVRVDIAAAEMSLETVEPSAAQIVGESFMAALRDADYATAYGLCGPDLQAEFDGAEGLGTWMQDNSIVPLAWTFESENVVDSMIQLLGTATFSGDMEAGFKVVVIEVDGEFLVAGFWVG